MSPRLPSVTARQAVQVLEATGFERIHQEVLHIHSLLLSEYGDRTWQPDDPVETLVSAILSQNTNDVNRDRAYERMRERFPTWEAVRDAPVKGLVEAISPAGLGPTKAPRVQEALRRITAERGEIALDFLADLPLEEARAWLLSIPGVGPKTAAIVLLFALGRPVFPVDTHIHRLSRRLGLIPQQATREQAHELLEALVPPEIYYPFHINLIVHGRAVCHAQRPECMRCILQEHCAYFASGGRGSAIRDQSSGIKRGTANAYRPTDRSLQAGDQRGDQLCLSS